MNPLTWVNPEGRTSSSCKSVRESKDPTEERAEDQAGAALNRKHQRSICLSKGPRFINKEEMGSQTPREETYKEYRPHPQL